MLFKEFQKELANLNTLLDEKNKEYQELREKLSQTEKEINKKTVETANLIESKMKYQMAVQELKSYRLMPLISIAALSLAVPFNYLWFTGMDSFWVISSGVACSVFGTLSLAMIPVVTHKARKETKKIVRSSNIDYDAKISELKEDVAREQKDLSVLRNQKRKVYEEKTDLENQRLHLVGIVTGGLLNRYRKENLDIPVASYEEGKSKVKAL